MMRLEAVFAGAAMSMRLSLLFLFSLLLSISADAACQSVGISITNTAKVVFESNGIKGVSSSNKVSSDIFETNATISFLQFQDQGKESELLGQTAFQDANGVWHTLPSAYDENGVSRPSGQTYTMGKPDYYHVQSTAIIKVTDIDQNTDRNHIDIIVVDILSPTGDKETLRLMETAANSGVFVGYIHLGIDPGIVRDGTLYVQSGDQITVTYDDDIAIREDKAYVIDRDNPKIWIEKKVNKTEASVGEILLYTLVVHNDEPVAFSDMVVEDRLPLGLKYLRNSARLEKKKVHPTYAKDGRTLFFDVSTLRAKSEMRIRFVSQIGAGNRHRYVTNKAVVRSRSTHGIGKHRFVSNTATARTRIIEELMRSKGVILGTVYACENFRKGIGIAGVRLYMEDGAYVTTDEYGRYHFEGIQKGLHVVQLDEDYLPEGYSVPQARHRSIRHAGREISQFVQMHTGVLKRIDFCLDGPVPQMPEPEAHTKKGEDRSKVSPEDQQAEETGHPALQSGGVNAEKGGAQTESRNSDIEYYSGEEEESAQEAIDGSGDKSEEENLSKEITDGEDGSAVVANKEEGNSTVSAPSEPMEADEGNTTAAEHSAPEPVISDTSEDEEEILPDDEDEEGGDEFIPTLSDDGKLVQESEPPSSRKHASASSLESSSAPVLPGEDLRQFQSSDPMPQKRMKRREIHTFEMPQYTVDTLYEAQSDAEILWPTEGYVPHLPSTEIAILHRKDMKIVVRLNGFEVNVRNYSGKINSPDSDKVIELYKGVDLLRRTNRIEVDFIDASGRVIKTLRRDVHVTGRPVYVEYVPEKSVSVADGKTNPVIAVRFYDADGYPLRKGVTGTFGIDDPYRSQTSIDEILNNPLGGASVGENRYTVGKDGIAYIKLQPTTQSGAVTLHFNILDRDEIVRAWLEPTDRKWLVVGYADGKLGYNSTSGSHDSVTESGIEEKTNFQGRVALFAKGSVNKWLLTMAYDSGKKRDETTFFNEIDPNAYYTLYNDNSIVNYEAPSRRKLFFKAEKERFSVLFGDYRTDMYETELAQYNRTFTGIESEYHGDMVEGKAFVAETDQLFVKDELPGDGTSGYYYLSNKNIIEFSEKIEIQVRDRYHPDRIVNTLILQRYKDYEIDYDRGRIYFKAPIYSRDRDFNPQYIVVDYELEGDGRKRYTYGGRIKGKWLKDKIQLGTTYVSEDNIKQTSVIEGVDLTIRPARTTTIKAEYARSSTTHESNTSTADAKFLEVEHLMNDMYIRAYFREQDQGFGLGQISGGLGGSRTYGVEFSRTYDNRGNLLFSAYRNSDLLSGKDQDVVEGRFAFEETFWSAYLGYRYAGATDKAAAHQVLLGGSYYLLDKRLKLFASHDQTFGKDENELFPTKTSVGIDYAVTSNASLFGIYEWQRGDKVDLEQGRIGLRYIPWDGMSLEETTLTENRTDGTRLYNTLAMRQTYQYDDHWSFSAGYEHGALLDGNVTQEEDDFNAYHLGATYRSDRWVGMGNIEYRESNTEQKYNLNLGIYRQLNEKLAMALSLDYNRDEMNDLNISGTIEDVDLRYSLAYRPLDEDFTVLDKLDWIGEKDGTDDLAVDTQKIVNNLSVNYQFEDQDAEITLQYGLKYVKDTVESYEYDGITQYLGIDAWYGLNEKWLIGTHESVLYAHAADNFDYAVGVYAGYNLYTNMFILAGYNWDGFKDRDFSLQNYQAQGPYIEFRMKFDQHNLRSLLGFGSASDNKAEKTETDQLISTSK